MSDLTWLEWIGVVSLGVHGTIGAAVTLMYLVGKWVDTFHFRKALLEFYWDYLKRKREEKYPKE